MPKLVHDYSPHQFALVRILLGLYLTMFWVSLLPYATELFSSTGMLSPSYTDVIFTQSPAWVVMFRDPAVVVGLCWVMIAGSVLLIIGWYRRFVSLALYLGWVLLALLNPFSVDPSLAFVGLLLLVYAVVPGTEPWTITSKNTHSAWYMPAVLYWGLWLVWATSFTISGYEKFTSELWRSGQAMQHFHTGVISLDTMVTWTLDHLPVFVGIGLTWVILYSQLAALFLATTNRGRQVFWCVTSGLFVMSLFVLDLGMVIVGMLVFYVFMVDGRWFRRTPNTADMFIDTDCNRCSWFGQFLQTEWAQPKVTVRSFSDPLLRQYLSDDDIAAMRQVVYVADGQVYHGADAMIHSVASLGGIWSAVNILRLIPRNGRDATYRVLSHWRRWL